MRKSVLNPTWEARVMSRAPRGVSGQLDYPTHQVGTAGAITLLVADTLGADGDALGQRLLPLLADAAAKCTSYFGGDVPTCNVILSPLSPIHDGSGGAYHYGCSGTDLYVDADTDPDGERVSLALMVAELAEVLMAAAGRGWDCGASPGEGLSRAVAEEVVPDVLNEYSTAEAWLDSDRHDWIGEADPTDEDAESTGCSVLFLWWLRSKGYQWVDIIAAGGSTLQDTWQGLGESGSAWDAFLAAVSQRWPAGDPSGVDTDNPWGEPGPGPGNPGEATDTVAMVGYSADGRELWRFTRPVGPSPAPGPAPEPITSQPPAKDHGDSLDRAVASLRTPPRRRPGPRKEH